MSAPLSKPCTAFHGTRRLAAGPLLDVALAVKAVIEGDLRASVLTFDDATGAVIDLDLRGSAVEIVARLSSPPAAATPRPAIARSASISEADQAADEPRGRGRPKLGVVAREVTLLPRHWDWLASQPGGASVVLRRLVEQARRADGGQSGIRARREASYRFIAAIAGDLPDFEEATRALFAGDGDRFAQHMATWPADLRTYALQLAAISEPARIEHASA